MVAGGQPKWTVLYAAFVIVTLCSWRELYRLDTVGWLVLVFIGWAVLSLLWSSDWRSGVLQVQNLVVLAGLFFAWRAWGKHLAEIVTIALAFALAIIVVAPEVHIALNPEYFATTSVFPSYSLSPAQKDMIIRLVVFGNENFSTEWVLMALPMAGYVVFGGERFERKMIVKIIALILFVLGLVYLFFNDSQLELVGLFSFMLCYFIWKRWWALAVIWVLVPLNIVLMWPELIPDGLMGSLGARAVFGINTASMWLDLPLFGHGFGSYNYEYPRYGMDHQALVNIGPKMALSNYIGAAHNEPLQLLAELGIVGFGIAGLVILAALRKPRFPLATLWILAGLMLTGFPLQNPATALLATLCLAEMSKYTRGYPRPLQQSLLERFCGAVRARCGGMLRFPMPYGRSRRNSP